MDAPRLPARRALLALVAGTGALLALDLRTAHGATLVAVRVWPAADYTRVTLEMDQAVEWRSFTVDDPPRLVVELDGVALDGPLRELVSKVQPNDPWIRQVRVGQNRPGVARLVFDLRMPAAPQVFKLDPVDRYRWRLVLDLRPAVEPDPLARLIQESEARARSLPADDPIAAAIAAAREGETKPPAPDAPPRAVTRLVTIALDPGHGGEDPGAVGKAGTLEKDVVLKVAKRLRQRIDAQPGMRAFLTREGDYFVPLGERVRKARAVRADLFVSIHADAFVNPEARGASVFALSDKGASSAAARWMAAQENRSDAVGGVNAAGRSRELVQVLADLGTTAQIRDSLRLGREVLAELGDVGRLHKPQVEQAGFAVLKAPDIPSILVETAFISNPEEEARLGDEAYQTRLADAIMAGIRRYFRRHPPGARGGTL